MRFYSKRLSTGEKPNSISFKAPNSKTVSEKSSPNPDPQDPKSVNIRHEIELLPSLCPTGEPAVRQVRLRQRALLEVYISSSLHGSGTIFLFVLFPKFFIFGALAEVIVEMDHYDTVVPMHKSQNVKNLREKDQNAKKKYARA